MDIRCRKTDCRHNDRLTCLVNKLNISNTTDCVSYEKVDGKGVDTSKQIFSNTDLDYCDYRHNKAGCIDCKHTCIFNNEGECRANGITVGDIKGKPKCITTVEP